MTKKIKSIKVINHYPDSPFKEGEFLVHIPQVNMKELLNNKLNSNCKVYYGNNRGVVKPVEFFESSPKFFEIEYVEEVEPVRYNPNGSLFDKPSTAWHNYWYVGCGDYLCDEELFSVIGAPFKTGCLFKIEEFNIFTQAFFDNEEKAKWWADMLNINAKIARKLQEINFENDFTPLGEYGYSYYLHLYNAGQEFNSHDSEVFMQGVFYVCGAAQDWFCKTDEYTKGQKIDFIKWYK